MTDLHVTVAGPARDAADRHVPRLVSDGVASGVRRQDPDLWGPGARQEAAVRLGWVAAHERSRELVEPITRLREELRAEGVDRVLLCGMGGSSLAPEVITATAGVPLTVLDSTDPDQVRRALAERPEATVVVVSSKSGTTVETDSQRRAAEAALRQAGVDPARRLVVVTDPGSRLEQTARDGGYRAVFLADPDVGGRYSALTAFGLVPAGLAGADVAALLDEAAAADPLLSADTPDNPALRLGAALGGTDPLRDKVVLVDAGAGLPGFGDWAEQLLAESTGKQGTGLLPVVVGPGAPELDDPADDLLVVHLEPGGGGGLAGTDPGPAHVGTGGPLGAQLLLWEYATAVAGRLLGVNPFDQPDVESAKQAARGLLDSRSAPAPPALTEDGVEVRGSGGLLDGVEDLDGALAALLSRLDTERGYLAVMAYVDREGGTGLDAVRDALAARTGRPVTFGYGPRFLHSTGQYHKGGPATGCYLQVTSGVPEDLPVPGLPFTFGELIAAQAAGDADVLAAAGRPVLRLHATTPAALDRVRTLLGGG
ncbi:glucose-6-phosphate isomerase [Quadrisphaera sp. GCM10027208]|uniref:glucose-6-phosphate isomerase n=1 Tax=Quadrisphaera sp. GCM10027208 TaxID=3273423 RepID=UPI00361B8724